jgi:surface antigen/uncharacterized protein YukE
MAVILITPPELRSKAEQLLEHARVIQQSLDGSDQVIVPLNGEIFSGARADDFRLRYQTRREQLLKLHQMVTRFATMLQEAANAFEKADQAAQSSVGNIAAWIAQIGAMKWTERFQSLKDLLALIQSLEEPFALRRPIELIETDIASVDQKIAELQAKRAEAEKKAKDLLNQIVPDFPLTGDRDGLPWRVKADDYEDEMAEYDRQIADLQGQKRDLETEKQLSIQNLEALKLAESKKSELQRVIDAGIPADGPTRSDLLGSKYGLGGCTHYVAEKRNVTDFGGGHPGHAYMWAEQARSAGFDTGGVPVKGAIMVFQPGIMGADKGAGHVAYVENIVSDGDSYKITISEASTIYRDGVFVRGVHTSPTTRVVTIPATGQQGVEFIYDKH